MLLAMLEAAADSSSGGDGAGRRARTTAWHPTPRSYAERHSPWPRRGREATPGADFELELLVAPAPPTPSLGLWRPPSSCWMSRRAVPALQAALRRSQPACARRARQALAARTEPPSRMLYSRV